MKLLIAGLVVEMDPKYEDTRKLAVPFLYEGDRAVDITLDVSDEYLNSLCRCATDKSTRGQMENLAFSTQFNRRAIRFQTMLVHSSAVVCDGRAYLFSADSGVGKSFHTRLWLQAFGDRVHILNDDKPVVCMSGEVPMVCGTPFDGGSGVALNESVPLGAIIFIERGGQNAVRVPAAKEIIQRLYFQTVRIVNAATADRMLDNFARLISMTKFYVLTCNTDIAAAYTAYNAIAADTPTDEH